MSKEIEVLLRDIPVEYQTEVNALIDRQITETNCTTDNDILAYLKALQADFEKGYYITPNGNMALLDIENPDELYADGGVDSLTLESDAENAATERKQNILKAAGIGILVTGFIIFLVVGRNSRNNTDELAIEEVMAVAEDDSGRPSFVPTAAPLQEIENQDEALETIGSLGGALTLGRPASLEIHYKATEEVVAFPIDPALVPPQGGLPFNEQRMASENPVAVWVLGTVLNYNIGIPDLYARNILPHDELVINTDTGSSLRFVVYATFDGNNYDPARQLAQDKVGVTLFSLPAPADNQVRFIAANYDITAEDTAVYDTLTQDDTIQFIDGMVLEITAVNYDHTQNGDVKIVIEGEVEQDKGAFLLALSSNDAQTESIVPSVHDENRWTAEFFVPDSFTGGAVSAEIRAIPSNQLLFVDLGTFARLDSQLQIALNSAYWIEDTQTVVINLTIENGGEHRVRVGTAYFKLTGGDQTQRREIQTIANLPLMLDANETDEITLTFSHRVNNREQLVLQAGSNLYELQLVGSE